MRCWRVVTPGKMYAVGVGWSKEVICWDPQQAEAGAWDAAEVPSLPDHCTYRRWRRLSEPDLFDECCVEGVAAAWLDGKLYITGGFENKSFARCFVWDPARPGLGWLGVADMRTARSDHKAVVLGGRMYVIGGQSVVPVNTPTIWLDSVERYDPIQDTWDSGGQTPFLGGTQCPSQDAKNDPPSPARPFPAPARGF